MNQESKIFVAGHGGLVGSAIVRHLRQHGYHNLLLRTHQETNLTHGETVRRLFERERPEYVFLAAKTTGRIEAPCTW